MTRFKDGPASGQTLMLRRTPMLLRVTSAGSKWDALDQPGDAPLTHETVYAYVLVERPGMAHINRGRHGSGFFPLATYQLVTDQPTDQQMRNTEQWRAWCGSNKHLVSHLS